MNDFLPDNIGLDLVRVTEATAIAASRWAGSGDRQGAYIAATQAMIDAIETVQIQGRIVIGEEGRHEGHLSLASGRLLGTRDGFEVDVVVDPIDGTNLLIKGHPGVVTLVGVAPKDTMWSPNPAVYMEKIVVDSEVAHALVPECLDAPAGWTIALVARAKNKAVRDVTVIVLDKPRHKDLIAEIRSTGARILLWPEADANGALLAATPHSGVDLLMGIGGAEEGVITACAIKAMNGGMLARLAPQDPQEKEAILRAGLNTTQIRTVDDIIPSEHVFFAATGITDSNLLRGVTYANNTITTHTLLLRGATHTRRFIRGEFQVT